MALIDQLASWGLGFFLGQPDYSFGDVTKAVLLTLFAQVDLKAFWAEVISTALINRALLGQLTSAVTNQQPSKAECLNNMTTWCPTQMVAAMLEERGESKWYSTCGGHRNRSTIKPKSIPNQVGLQRLYLLCLLWSLQYKLWIYPSDNPGDVSWDQQRNRFTFPLLWERFNH